MRHTVHAVFSLVLLVLSQSCNRDRSLQAVKAEAAAASSVRNSPSSDHVHGDGHRVNITVDQRGFSADHAELVVGQPATLVVTRAVERTCATDILIDEYGIRQPLPLNKPVEFTFTPTKPGDIQISCAMHMVSGKLTAK